MSHSTSIPSSPISTIESMKVTMESTTAMDQKLNSEDDNGTTTTTTSPLQQPQKGIAGRINYAQWDKVTKDLVTQIDEESQQETIEEQKKVSFRFMSLLFILWMKSLVFSESDACFY
jgi:negative regulator of replication initiation